VLQHKRAPGSLRAAPEAAIIKVLGIGGPEINLQLHGEINLQLHGVVALLVQVAADGVACAVAKAGGEYQMPPRLEQPQLVVGLLLGVALLVATAPMATSMPKVAEQVGAPPELRLARASQQQLGRRKAEV